MTGRDGAPKSNNCAGLTDFDLQPPHYYRSPSHLHAAAQVARAHRAQAVPGTARWRPGPAMATGSLAASRSSPPSFSLVLVWTLRMGAEGRGGKLPDA